jgi:hypothetical protein
MSLLATAMFSTGIPLDAKLYYNALNLNAPVLRSIRNGRLIAQATPGDKEVLLKNEENVSPEWREWQAAQERNGSFRKARRALPSGRKRLRVHGESLRPDP